MMNKSFLFFGALFYVAVSMAQEKLIPKLTTITHPLGNNAIKIKLYQYGLKKDIVFINLHSDETTSVEGAQKILEIEGGLLIQLENGNKRNLSFQLNGRLYAFDPNRIFSKIGIQHTLERFKNISDQAVEEVEQFANHILALLPEESLCIVALHNNTEGGLAITSYLPGNIHENDAKKVHADPKQDEDDFFLTTDSALYAQLAKEKYNTILQDNLSVQQDGSLSVYCGEKNICYLNCETEHGKIKQYEQMLRVALKYISKRK